MNSDAQPGGVTAQTGSDTRPARKLELGRSSARVRSNPTGHVKKIQVELEVQAPHKDAALRRLVEVAERGCHIKAMLRAKIAFELNVSRVAL
ncbi:MAG TPA: hypothetical protein VMV27_08905 [Candidatus Binataceae bacterium]|nr:hypothetical protein [Candidatus Binataceae bacterium]